MSAITTISPQSSAPTQPPVEQNWQNAVLQKRKECLKKTPSEWLLSSTYIESLHAGPGDNTNLIELDVPRKSGTLSEKELDITEHYSARQLLQLLANQEFTSVEVTTAFSKRAAIAQQLVRRPLLMLMHVMHLLMFHAS